MEILQKQEPHIVSESTQASAQTPTTPADGLQPDGGMGPHLNDTPTDAGGTDTINTGGSDTGTTLTPDGGMGPH